MFLAVRFQIERDEQTGVDVVKFEVLATHVDFRTGILNWTNSDWKSHPLAHNRVNYGADDNPFPLPLTRKKFIKNIKISQPKDDYVIFGHSNMRFDSGQEAVPFIDMQPVVPKPVGPLIGAGLYWKSSQTSGGFVGVLVQPNDYEDNVFYGARNETILQIKKFYVDKYWEHGPGYSKN